MDFPIFQGAAKRFGYRTDLNVEHMNSIKKLIRLNIYEMEVMKQSAYAIVYKDENFSFKDKRHNVSNLLKIGFLLCRFTSLEDQEVEFWHLVNPKLDEVVSKQTIKDYLADLIYVAIDMNMNLIKMGDDNESEEA